MKISILGTQYSFYTPLYKSTVYMSDHIKYYNHTYDFYLNDSGAIVYKHIGHSSGFPFISGNNYIEHNFNGPLSFMYYGNELISATLTYSGKSYSLTGSFGNVVCDDGTIYGTDYLIPCDADKITDDYLTKAFTCDPSISIGNDYITNDTTWQESIADAGSGSIAFPLDLDDLIDSSASDVRDKTLTDTGDIATDKTDDKTDTETDTKDDTISDSKDIADILHDKIPAIQQINDIISGFNNANSKGFYFEFVFYKKKYVIDCAFYEPYRQNVRGVLSVLFIVMTFLTCFKLFRSCIGISFSGGEGDNDDDQ